MATTTKKPKRRAPAPAPAPAPATSPVFIDVKDVPAKVLRRREAWSKIAGFPGYTAPAVAP